MRRRGREEAVELPRGSSESCPHPQMEMKKRLVGEMYVGNNSER